MRTFRHNAGFLLIVLAVEGSLVTDPIRPWLPFSLWTFEGSTISTAGLVAFSALAIIGGLLPFPFPGLRPLPITFPFIGACLLLYGLPPASALAAATILVAQWRRRAFSPPSPESLPAPGAAALAGMGLGLLAADLSGLVLPDEPLERGSVDFASAMTIAFCLSAGAIFAVWLSRWLSLERRPERGRLNEILTVLIASPVASGLALAVAQAVRVWGLGPVALWLAPPFAVLAPLAVLLTRGRSDLDAEKRRASTALEILEALALAIEAKDRTSERHLRRMRALARGLGRRLGMTREEIAALDLAALLHDIGKLAVPEWILSKPGRLTAEEFEKMTVHSETGGRILEAVPSAKEIAPLVRHHHEHYDGTGYPAGLEGVEIPLGARILAVVDAVDSITSERSYRHAVGKEEALRYIREKAGTLFDPRIVGILIEEFESLQSEADLATMPGPAADVDSREAEPEPASAPSPGESSAPRIQEVLDTIASSHMEIYSLHEIGQALGKALSVEESLSLIAGRLGRLFHFSACAVYLVDRERRVLTPRLAAGLGAELIGSLQIPIGSGVSGWAAQEKMSLISAPPTDPLLPHGARSDLDALAGREEVATLRSTVVAPLMADQEVVGVVALYDTAENPYGPAEERLLSMVARQVGQAVRNGLLFERAQEETLTDALTGLPNTRYMFVSVEQEFARARDTGEPLSLLLMDIDGFARLNEEFGYPAGDRFLIGVSKLIRTLMRDRDTCVRYSGDEFVAILPGVAREEAMQVAERIRKAVKSFAVDVRPGVKAQTTMSVGHATFSLDGEKFEEIMMAAEERLAQEKTERRAGAMSGSTLLPFHPGKPPRGHN